MVVVRVGLLAMAVADLLVAPFACANGVELRHEIQLSLKVAPVAYIHVCIFFHCHVGEYASLG
jgi:hypothetical protein